MPPNTAPTVTEPVELRLAPVPTAAAATRRRLEEHVQACLSREAAANLKLVASELVNNAVEHGAGEITVRLDVLQDAIRVEVIDGGSRSTPAIRDAAGEGGGWGLRIVESLSRRWGVFEGSTHVWAEVPR